MIIGISGKKGVGKDTVATIIQYLIDQSGPYYLGDKEYEYSYEELEKELITLLEEGDKLEYPDETGWKNVKFADKIKDIVCLLIGCTREQLEDQEFKETPLGEEWTKYKCVSSYNNKWFNTEEEALQEAKSYYKYLLEKQGKYKVTYEVAVNTSIKKQVMTPRLLMQLMGTECGREIIHPDIWVNSLFSNYKEDKGYSYKVEPLPNQNIENDNFKLKVTSGPIRYNNGYPNWIISDVRFLNEVRAIIKREGLLIRVERDLSNTSNHESEIALDDFQEWDYIIDNTGSLEELIDKVKDILIKENLYERNN